MFNRVFYEDLFYYCLKLLIWTVSDVKNMTVEALLMRFIVGKLEYHTK